MQGASTPSAARSMHIISYKAVFLCMLFFIYYIIIACRSIAMYCMTFALSNTHNVMQSVL